LSGRSGTAEGAEALDARMSEAIAELSAAIAAARQILAEGAMPDLAGLDLRVGEICRGVDMMTPEAGRRHLSGLLRLAAALTALEADCRNRRDRPPQPAALRHRAAGAYGHKPDGRKPGGRKPGGH
jgi:hypothetical protein